MLHWLWRKFISPMKSKDIDWHCCKNCSGHFFAACGCAMGFEKGLQLEDQLIECPSVDMHPGPIREFIWRIMTHCMRLSRIERL